MNTIVPLALSAVRSFSCRKKATSIVGEIKKEKGTEDNGASHWIVAANMLNSS